MATQTKLRVYEGENVVVRWDGRLCIHVGECGRAKNELFVKGREPWCQPDSVDVANVEEVIERCPSGALGFERRDGRTAEVAEEENVVVVSNNGPLYLRGDLQIEGADDEMPGVKFRAALCRCGQSRNKPFCDNSHEETGFSDRGAVGETGDGAADDSGPLLVKLAPNGPLLLSGPFTIVASSGRRAWHGTKAALCRCGQSRNKPFCDGSHKAFGFDSTR
ncbi:MAG: CDGSH iron-sulfur domain-containing protein [Myxococcales bacterium]|nr:CDGSH iron-sulfur domain-containing protein [Myxococcales bacterium]